MVYREEVLTTSENAVLTLFRRDSGADRPKQFGLRSSQPDHHAAE